MINETLVINISLAELSAAAQLPEAILLEVIEHGILEPVAGNSAQEWQFSRDMISVLQKAVRLHQDLEINWQGIAMVLELLEQREQLLSENAMLRQILGRFIESEES